MRRCRAWQVPFWPEALTTMGKLFPYAKARAGAGESTIAHFREAAKADTSSSLVWEMLGELLAPSDPAGAPQSSCLPSGCPCRNLLTS